MDLSTTYLGLKLKNPLVPSASPLSHTLDSMKRLEDAGAAAEAGGEPAPKTKATAPSEAETQSAESA